MVSSTLIWRSPASLRSSSICFSSSAMGFSNSIVVAAAMSAPANEADALLAEQRPQFGECGAGGRELQGSGPQPGPRAVAITPAELDRRRSVMGFDHGTDIVHDLGRHARAAGEVDGDRHLPAGAKLLEAGHALDDERGVVLGLVAL